MRSGNTTNPEWRAVYQKLYFARVCLDKLEQTEAKPEIIALRQSALIQVFSSLCAYIEFVSFKTIAQPIPLFSRDILKQWQNHYPPIAEIQWLEQELLNNKILFKLVLDVELALSSKPLQSFSAPPSDELLVIQTEQALGDEQDIQSIREGIIALEAFYDVSAESLEEY